jgi:hypothetical protein
MLRDDADDYDVDVDVDDADNDLNDDDDGIDDEVDDDNDVGVFSDEGDEENATDDGDEGGSISYEYDEHFDLSVSPIVALIKVAQETLRQRLLNLSPSELCAERRLLVAAAGESDYTAAPLSVERDVANAGRSLLLYRARSRSTSILRAAAHGPWCSPQTAALALKKRRRVLRELTGLATVEVDCVLDFCDGGSCGSGSGGGGGGDDENRGNGDIGVVSVNARVLADVLHTSVSALTTRRSRVRIDVPGPSHIVDSDAVVNDPLLRYERAMVGVARSVAADAAFAATLADALHLLCTRGGDGDGASHDNDDNADNDDNDDGNGVVIEDVAIAATAARHVCAAWRVVAATRPPLQSHFDAALRRRLHTLLHRGAGKSKSDSTIASDSSSLAPPRSPSVENDDDDDDNGDDDDDAVVAACEYVARLLRCARRDAALRRDAHEKSDAGVVSAQAWAPLLRDRSEYLSTNDVTVRQRRVRRRAIAMQLDTSISSPLRDFSLLELCAELDALNTSVREMALATADVDGTGTTSAAYRRFRRDTWSLICIKFAFADDDAQSVKLRFAAYELPPWAVLVALNNRGTGDATKATIRSGDSDGDGDAEHDAEIRALESMAATTGAVYFERPLSAIATRARGELDTCAFAPLLRCFYRHASSWENFQYERDGVDRSSRSEAMLHDLINRIGMNW